MQKTKTTEKLKFRFSMLIVTWIIGLVIYKTLPIFGTGKILFENVSTVANIVSTFCVALIGFLSGIIVILSGLKDSFFFRSYKNSGHLNNFLFYYFFTIISLIVTHLISIASISSYFWMKVLIASITMNVLQIIFLITITHFVSAKNED